MFKKLYYCFIVTCATLLHSHFCLAQKLQANTTNYLPKNKIDNLAKLGMLWGYVKYHAPNVCLSKIDMDKQLLSLIPKITEYPSKDSTNKILLQWLKDSMSLGLSTASKNIPNDTSQIKFKLNIATLLDTNEFSKELVTIVACLRNTHCNADSHNYYNIKDKYNLSFTNEKTYSDSEFYTNANIRLLSLFRYWNVIAYFYPYKHLIGERWENILYEYIPLLLQQHNNQEYVLIWEKIIARIHDTHAHLYGKPVREYYKDLKRLPLYTSFVENKLVIVDIYDTLNLKTKLEIGDIILKVNGVSADSLIIKKLPYTSASNYTKQLSIIASDLLKTFDSNIDVTIQKADNTVLNLSIPSVVFSMYMQPKTIYNFGFKKLNANTAYLNPLHLNHKAISSIDDSLKNIKHLIIDLRSHTYLDKNLINYLKSGTSTYAEWYGSSNTFPGDMTHISFEESGSLDTSINYKGNIAILVNNNTLSSSEFSTMSLASSKNTIVIGDTTAGADGNVSFLTLPGNLKTSFTALGICYPDGTPSQRLGVKIDYNIKPTINGIKQGIDEQLEFAIKQLNK